MGLASLGHALRGRTAWLFSGYKPSDFKAGLQLMLSWAAILAIVSPLAVWNKLSSWGASPTLLLVLSGLYLQPYQGGTQAAAVLGVAGACLAAVVGFIPTYSALAANGGTYEGYGAAKGATLVAVGSALAALLVVPRIRFAVLGMVFQMCGFLLALRLFETYWMPTPEGYEAVPVPPNSVAYYTLLAVVIPLAVVVPVVWLVFPSPAGRQVRAATCRMLRNLGRLGAGVIELALQPEQPVKGGSGGAECTAPDGQPHSQQIGSQPAPIAEQAAALHEADTAIRQDISKLGTLLLLSLLEIDVYRRPRRLNGKAYKGIKGLVAAADSCLSLTLRWLAGRPGEPRLSEPDRSLCRQVAPQLRAVQAALAACCEGLAAAIEDSAPFGAALESLLELESSWAALRAALPRASASLEAGMVAGQLRGLLFLAFSKVRALCAEVAAAVDSMQPGSRAAVAAHLATAAWAAKLVPQAPAVQQAEEGLLMAAAAAPPGLAAAPGDGQAAGADADSKLAHPSGRLSCSSASAGLSEAGADKRSPAQAAEQQAGGPAKQPAEPARVVRPSAALEARPRSAVRRALERAGLGLPQLLPALHMAVLFAAAGTLTVCRQAFLGLGGRSPWVAFTVNSAFEKSQGQVFYRCVNRLLGTIAGVGWASVVIAVSVAAGQASYDGSPGQYAAMAVLVSLWGGFVGANRTRHPRFAYAWTVAMIAVPVVVLEFFRSGDLWTGAKWRIACVAIGVGMDALVTSVFFPVTTGELMLQQLLQAMACLAALSEGVAACHAGEPLPPPAGGQVGTAGTAAGDAAAAAAGEVEAGAAQEAAGQQAAAARQQLQALAQKAKTHSLRFVALSSDALGGPVRARRRTQRRHETVLTVQDLLAELIDGLVLLLLADELRGGAGAAGLPPAGRALAVAVGQQIGESLRCLRHVLRRRLPIAAALRTLPALDQLLRQLAAAAGDELHRLHTQPPDGGRPNGGQQAADPSGGQPEGVGSNDGQLEAQPAGQQAGELQGGPLELQGGRVAASFTADRAPLTQFTAAALGSARTLRQLYYTLAVVLMPDNEQAVAAAEGELRRSQPGLVAMAAAQRAAAASCVEG